MNVSPTEHDGDDVSDEPSILILPIEMLKKVLMYVDDYSRVNASLVCHTFYELICELDRDKNPLSLRYSEVIAACFHIREEVLLFENKNFRFTMMASTNRWQGPQGNSVTCPSI